MQYENKMTVYITRYRKGITYEINLERVFVTKWRSG